MAVYFVDSARADDTGSGLTWALAKKTIQAALTAASSGADVVVVKSTVDHTFAADTTLTTANSVSVIAATADDAATAYTPAVMGETNFIGNSATSYSIALAAGADDKVYLYGLTLRVASTTAKNITLGNTVGVQVAAENCLFWQSGTGTGTTIGSSTGTVGFYKACTFKFSAAGQGLVPSTGQGGVEFVNCIFSGTSLTNLITNSAGTIVFAGCDVSAMAGNLVGNITVGTQVQFVQCKLHASATVLATQSGNPTRASASALVLDSSSGDTHGLFGYYDALGSVISSTGTKLTAGAAGQSWQITTTANCSFVTPFVTPWISLYSAAASATTYKLELLRNNGTATTYSDAEVWGEFSVKDNSGFTNSDIFTDRQALVDWAAGTAGSTSGRTGTGTGNWTIGSSNNPASFIVDSGTTITQAEDGHIRARVAVGLASVSNLFLDPQIRT